MRKISDKTVQKIKTHILVSETFFPESRTVYNVEKYGRAGKATVKYDTVPALGMLGN